MSSVGMKKPIYLYITPFFPSRENWRGGFCLDAVKALMHDGRYDVRVIKCENGDDYCCEGVRVYRLERNIFPCGLAPFLLAWLNNKRFFEKLDAMGIAIDNVAVCHVNSFDYGYSYAIKKINPNVKSIMQTHWMGPPFNLSSGRLGIVPIHANLLYSYYKRLLEAADLVVVLSNLHKQQFGLAYPQGPLGNSIDIRDQLLFGRYYEEIKPGRICVFYNGIDTHIYNPQGRKASNEFLIGCVANFIESKDQMTLLKAMAYLVNGRGIDKLDGRRICVRMIGSGPMLARCKEYVSLNNLTTYVKFESEMAHYHLADFYRSLDLFVLPTWQEGFCCTLVEAIGCGTPAISSKIVSFGEVVADNDKERWLIEPKNYTELAEKIVAYSISKKSLRLNREMDIRVLWKEFLDGI